MVRGGEQKPQECREAADCGGAGSGRREGRGRRVRGGAWAVARSEEASVYLAQSLEKRVKENPLPPQPRNTQSRGTFL